MIEIFTDGSATNNGSITSVGGWSAVVYRDGQLCSVTAANDIIGATNNQMEMKAIIWALEYYGDEFPSAIVYSDSSYCINTFTDWMYKWKNNGWTRGKKHEPVENLDLVKEYYNLEQSGKSIVLRKVAGHSGNQGNELADALATGRMKVKEIVK